MPRSSPQQPSSPGTLLNCQAYPSFRWWSFGIGAVLAQHITKNAPYAWGNFHACAVTRFQKPQQLSWAGRSQHARRSPRAQRAETRSQQPALLQTAAETTAACWWIYWQRRLESWSSSSSLQRGWSARMATRWSSHHPACSIRYQSLHVSSSANDFFKKFTGARSRRPHHWHFSHGWQNRSSSFCRCRVSHGSGRGENLVTFARFAKPLFANMHHHVHAVAGALRKPNVACPHPDVSTWPVWWWCDRRWVRTPQMPPFVGRTDFFFICTLR